MANLVTCCRFSRLQRWAIVLAAGGLLGVEQVCAQSGSAAKSGSAATQSVLAAPSDASVRAKILASDEWKQIGDEYQQWLSKQPIYTPSQIKQINDNLAAQIQSMPTSELQDFMNDWQAKLKVLNGKNFQEAQNWLGQYMTNMADGYRRNYLKSLGLTDIPNMTAAQLESAMTEIRAQRQSISQSQSAFDKLRNQQLQSQQNQQSANQQTLQQSGSQSYINLNDGGFQGPYSPAFGNNFLPPVGSYLPL